MKLASYNIRFSLGQDGRYDLARVAESVREADLIALQEVERCWPRSGLADQPAELAALLADHHWVYGPAFDVDASRAGGAEPARGRRRQFGPMLLCRSPILSSRLHLLPKIGTGPGGAFNMDTGALEGVIETGAGPLRVYSLHLSAMSAEDRLLQLDALLALLGRAPRDGGAWSGDHNTHGGGWSCGEPPPPMPEQAVLLGDFNAEPQSEEYARLTRAGGFVDAWAAAGNDPAGVITWSPYPGAVPNREMRLDYCFLSPGLAGRVRSAWVDRAALGSDHYPVWVDIDLETGA